MSLRLATLILVALFLTGCAPVETKTTLTTPITSQVRTARPGNTVMSFQSRRSLPNIVGKADLFGRTTNAGGTTVRFVGIEGQKAVFERVDMVVQSNATTMTETPLIIPQSTTTNLSGSIGSTPVSGTAASTTYRYIPPRGSSQQAMVQRPVYIRLGKGQSVSVQGKTLKVVGLDANAVIFTIR